MLGFEEKTVFHWPRFFEFSLSQIFIEPCFRFPCHDEVQEVVFWILPWEKVSSRGHLSAPAPPAVQRNTWTQLKEIPSTQLKEICSTQLTKRSEKYKDWGNDATQGGKTDGKLRKNEEIENFVLIFLQQENRIV